MKLVGLFAGALAGVSAQNPAALARLYSQNVERSNGDARSVMFAKALEAKISAYQEAGLEIPAHVTQTVLASVAGGGVARASPFCPTDGGCTATISLEQIWNYGCWCMLATPEEGAGITMDSYDAACRDMVKCNQCAKIDSGAGCDAATTGFQVDVSWDTAAMGFNMDCSTPNADANDNFCSEHLCSCEMSFFAKVLDLLWEGAERTDEFQENQGFDRNQCIIDVGAPIENPNKDPSGLTGVCCGVYPDRKELSAVQSCCNDARYNTNTEECCPNGTVAETGSCP